MNLLGAYVDPMYILIPLFLVMIVLMIGLASIMFKMLTILRGIHEENLYANRLARASDIADQQTGKSASVVQSGSTYKSTY